MNYERLDPDKKDILIIDDMADNLRVLSSLLTREGFNVRKALNWQMALTACQTVLPDLILLDIMMPDVDGYEVCQRFKAWELTADIPVVFISALDDVFDKVRAFLGSLLHLFLVYELLEPFFNACIPIKSSNIPHLLVDVRDLLRLALNNDDPAWYHVEGVVKHLR